MTQVLGHEWVTPVGRAIGWPSSYRSPGKSFTVPFTTVCSGRYLASRGLGRQQVRGLTPISPPPGERRFVPGAGRGRQDAYIELSELAPDEPADHREAVPVWPHRVTSSDASSAAYPHLGSTKYI